MRPHALHTQRPLLLAMLVLALGALIPASAAAQQRGAGELWIEAKDEVKPRDEVLRWSSVSRLAESISPAVVNVLVAYEGSEGLESFFEAGGGYGPRNAQGSGFIIHPSGYFLTNNHVVEGASSVRVKLIDDRELPAEVVGVDPETDVALLKITEGGDYPAVTLGDSDQVHVGENVLAIGNPLGLSHTVTAGIVSALSRRNLSPDGRDLYSDFIQTDASINPGNSGGPLISLRGEVIAINTAINREGQGIGFAIPINIVKTLLPHLHEKGYVVRTWLGIRIQPLSPALAKSFGMKRARGALVTEVVDASPAAKAGLKAGDVILRFGTTEIRDSDQLPWLASTGGADGGTEVELLRDGKRMKLEVRLEELPDQKPPALPGGAGTSLPARSRELGVVVKELGASLARQLGAAKGEGVVVTEIADASPARGSGLRRRDVITEVGSAGVTSADEFTDAVAKYTAGDVMRFKVIRGGRVVYVAFER